MITFTKETCQILKINIKNILIFELLYRLMTGPIFLQILNWAVKFSLNRAGYSYLTLNNLVPFLLKPWTMIVILVIGTTGLFLIMVEVGAFITAYSAAAYSIQMKPLDILFGGLRNVKDELLRRNGKLAGVVFIEFILLNGFVILRVLTNVKPLNFVMKTMLEEPIWRLLLILAVFLFVLIAIPATFVVHGCMVEQKSFRDSMNRSLELLRGRWIKTVFRLVSGQLFLIFSLMAAYFFSVLLTAVIVILFVEKNLEFAFLMEAGGKIEAVLLFLGSIFAWILYFAQVTVQYYQYDREGDGQPRWDFYFTGGITGKRSGMIVLCTLGIASALCLFDTAYNGNFITRSIPVKIEVTAHRGSSKTAPENTMAAIAAAVEEMADRVEIDVQETSDGQVVLFHDNTLKRITGGNRKIADMSYEELQAIDAGSWFSKDYKGESIPLLEQVMEYTKGKIDLNIEIKNRGNDSYLPEKVLEMVKAYEMEEQCVITSTNLNYLQRIKTTEPEIKTGYILSAAYGNYYSDESVDFISIRSSFVTESLMEKCHEAGRAVHAWTVNSKGELERLRMLGVDNIITDYPVLAREILYREDVAESMLEYLRILLK